MHLSLLTLILFSLCLCSLSVFLGAGVAILAQRNGRQQREEEFVDEKRSYERKLTGLKDSVVKLQGEVHEGRVKMPAELEKMKAERDQLTMQLKMFEENYRTLAQQSRDLNEKHHQGQHQYQSLKQTYTEHVSQLQRMNQALQVQVAEFAHNEKESEETSFLRSFPAPSVEPSYSEPTS